MIDWAERSLCILLSLCILANALLVRRSVQAWAFPAVLFSLAWFIYTIVPLVCFPSAHVYPIAMLYIFSASAVVSLAGVANWKRSFSNSLIAKSLHNEYYRDNLLLILFFVAFGLAVFCLLMNSIAQGISINQLVSNINASAAEYAGRRYSYDISSNIYQQLGNVLAYFCAGVGGLIFISHKSKYLRSLIVILALFPSIFVMLSQSAKGMLFLCAAIFFGGIIGGRIQYGRTNLFSKQAIPAATVGLLAAVALVTASFLARGVSATAGGSIIDALAPYWASYTSGHLFAFSDWFGSYVGQAAAQPYDDPGMTHGFYTFMAIFKLFGDDRPISIGVYSEYLSIPPYIETNIYTLFRGMIHDYGLVGSLVCLGALSFLTHYAFRAMLNAAMPTFSVSIFIFATAFIYQSFIISSLTWTTLPIGLLLIGVALFFVKIRIMNRNT